MAQDSWQPASITRRSRCSRKRTRWRPWTCR
nr:MAG TPA: hypothetical protein [Caudoviricetes sp.]